MPYEFLQVVFPRPRQVLINGEPMGNTNVLLELEGGEYTVTLTPPEDYTPPRHQINLRHTSALNPLVIEFKEM